MSLPVTEDTPPDMLAGSMDLKVILPDGHNVKMSVHRGTPMMDLLVQVTTAHCLSPGDYSLQAMGDKGVLPFKPSTPIGVLDTFTVKIVEKKLQSRGRAPQVPQSFLNTFRLQVHLPRSQLFVIRVTSDVTLSEIMTHICTEKNLNFEKYEFRNPANLEEVLELDKTLGYYKLQELTMMSKGNRTLSGLMSSADIINVKSSKNRQNSVCDSSLSSGSYGSRSGSPIPAINVVTVPPQPPIRKKRRPAPKPPGFVEKDKKEQTTSSVLISHSRESSDSSGYHEASVLSESPVHGGPAVRIESDSPPDSLPRRTKLPPSQSFTNLTSIQATPRSRLKTSVSNTSLNFNGYSRKKRAPPPPPVQSSSQEKVKSSTLPSSITEERRNGSYYTNKNTVKHFQNDTLLEVSNTKVQSPKVELESKLINETKATKDEVPASLDVNIRLPPKPKPRTVVPDTETAPPKNQSQTNLNSLNLNEGKSGEVFRPSGSLNRWNNFENLTEEFSGDDKVFHRKSCGDEQKNTSVCSLSESKCFLTRSDNHKDVQNSLFSECSEIGVEPPPEESQDLADHDSINWEYQLPPPPTDFRDTNSPNCTEYETVTINPDILENLGEYKEYKSNERLIKEDESVSCQTKFTVLESEELGLKEENKTSVSWNCSDKKLRQSKVEVMNELTNILNGDKKHKEKSLSVSNLCVSDFSSKDSKKNCLTYSRSFSTEPVFSLEHSESSAYKKNGLENNMKFSNSNELLYNREINYKNYKNLEKSLSMECIQTKTLDNQSKLIEKSEDVFRKPVAPVQKKLKIAKRSASSIDVNTFNSQKKNSDISQNDDSWSDDTNIHILRQQFLEFLKEKKLMRDDLKSLDVIRNILPELNVEKDVQNDFSTNLNVVVNKKESNIQENICLELKGDENKDTDDSVKVADVKNFGSTVDDGVLRRDFKEPKSELIVLQKKIKPPEKNQEIKKRYSYQGPPSINFTTWGERPKTTTRIIIKDEDYVTQEKVIEKKTEMQNKHGDTLSQQKPKEVKKSAQIVIKKPGILSHYEMFSALPKRKEVSSLELIHMEDEEKKKRDKSEPKEFNRIPIVCGVELKKEFKSSSPTKSKQFLSADSVSDQECNKPRHSTSVYVNGNQDSVGKEKSSTLSYNFIIPKRNSAVMPVVKGFRHLEETTNHVNISNSSNHININIRSKINDASTMSNQETFFLKKQSNVPAPPPPPNISIVKLKPVTSGIIGKPKTASQDSRNQLLEEIRHFGGLRNLKKSVTHY